MRWFDHFSAAPLYKLIQNITNIVGRSSTSFPWPFPFPPHPQVGEKAMGTRLVKAEMLVVARGLKKRAS